MRFNEENTMDNNSNSRTGIEESKQIGIWIDAFYSMQNEQSDCEDCIKHGGDWECDRVHCHKGDAISGRAAIDICNSAIDLWHGQLGEGALVAVKEGIESLPSAEPERKKGKWIHDNPNTFRCSECNKYLDISCGNMKMNFCPNCGADMREGDSDEKD